MADSKWKGVDRLATDARSCVAMNATIRTIQEEKKQIEELLRERLEPLLEAADRVTAMRCSVPVDDWHLIDSLRREVAKWR